MIEIKIQRFVHYSYLVLGFTNLEVVVITSCLVQEVRGLDEFWSQWMLPPVDLEVKSEGLGDEGVHLHHLIQHLVCLNGWFQVSREYLKSWPEGQEGVHEIARFGMGTMH